jgi:hypothetical protein
MERAPTLAIIDRILAPDGRIVICSSRSLADEVNPWHSAYGAALRSWGESRGSSHRQLYERWFDGSRFVWVADIRVRHSQDITPEALAKRALTRSTTSPAVLGQRMGAFRAALGEALTPFFPDSVGLEVVEARAAVYPAV